MYAFAVRVGLYVDNTLAFPVDRLCEALNPLCKTVTFVAGTASFRLATPEISSPSGGQTLSPQVLAEASEFDLACFATNVPYDNNHFFDSRGGCTLISFSGWNSLTDLPVTNGFVYFLASILAHEAGIGTTHDQNTGCINDFWWDKSGVDVGMRAAFICGDCVALGTERPVGAELVADVRALLDAVSKASRADEDVLAALSSQANAGEGFDVFLCYSSADREEIRRINEAMKAAGLVTWFDEERFVPGEFWLRQLERDFEQIRAVCAFIGPSGPGPWQENEIGVALDRFNVSKVPVIPVLLLGAEAAKLPLFLGLRHALDLRTEYERNWRRLIEFLQSRRLGLRPAPRRDDGTGEPAP